MNAPSADYETPQLAARLAAMLDSMFPHGTVLSVRDLGLNATVRLMELLSLDADSKVPDAGSRLGGPARSIAETFGARATGIDDPFIVETWHVQGREAAAAFRTTSRAAAGLVSRQQVEDDHVRPAREPDAE